jgi:glycerophosphoryl diester phosphodiesterase
VTGNRAQNPENKKDKRILSSFHHLETRKCIRAQPQSSPLKFFIKSQPHRYMGLKPQTKTTPDV